MIIISNTSPIINLAVIGQLSLLERLYNRITIAQAVYEEIVIAGAGLPGSNEVSAGTWIETKPIGNRNLVDVLEIELDKGEAETLALALELKPSLVLLDEKNARRVAGRLGLKIIGLIGILIEAKEKGLILEVKPILDDLVIKAGFWINPRLYDDTLQATGEA